jgi:hypothetical protein
MAAKDNAPIISYEHGFYASNTDVGSPGRGPGGMHEPKIDPPNLLSFVPPVPNSTGGNIAKRSGFDTLSSGTVRSDTKSAIVGILSSPGFGQHWGCRDVTSGSPAMSAVGVLWTLPGGQSMENTSGTYAQRSAAGIAGNGTSTRKVHLSTGFIHEDSHAHQRTTTILTHLSCAMDLAIVYHDGSTAAYSLSADASMKNTTFSGNGYTGHKGLSARGKVNDLGNYRNFDNVGPNIRRLVALGYR